MMRKIDLQRYKRRELFIAFKDRDVPYFATTCNVDISNLSEFIGRTKFGFFMCATFIISRAVNLVPELRHRIIGGELFEFSRVDPAYTVLLDDGTFSFCDSRHFDGFAEYRKNAQERIAEATKHPDRSNKEKPQSFLITNIPWFSFTSFVHPYYNKYGSIPIVTIGRYFKQDSNVVAPVAVQVHHAVADGVHVAKFYDNISRMCSEPEAWLK